MKTKPVAGEDIDRVVAATRGSTLFESLDDDQLRQAVTQATLLQLDPGESLIRQGEPPGASSSSSRASCGCSWRQLPAATRSK